MFINHLQVMRWSLHLHLQEDGGMTFLGSLEDTQPMVEFAGLEDEASLAEAEFDDLWGAHNIHPYGCFRK